MSVDIRVGDCLEVLRTLPEKSVQCCVTSPPYFGLRDYGHAGQIGLEATPDAFVAKLVAVFAEVRRVLRDDGTLWLNLGDSYAASPAGGDQSGSVGVGRSCVSSAIRKGMSTIPPGVRPKNLLGIPWSVAFALRDAGWYLRSDIIWHKPNPMPESVTDRPTKAHEYLFLLTKSDRYYYDAAAVAEPVADTQVGRVRSDVVGGKSHAERGQHSKGGTYKGSSFNRGKTGVNGNGRQQPDSERADPIGASDLRNRRSVWTVATQPFSEAHFATFPPKLIEPCILAGSRLGDTVLDPFGGAGTTGLVADRLGRNALLIELNPEYAEMARRRITNDAPLFAGGAA